MHNVKSYNGSEPYIFVSYCHRDNDVYNLIKELTENKFRLWYDEGIKSGRAWADDISSHIKNCTQFLVFLSNNAIESENVKDEIHLAIKHKKDILVVHLENIVLEGGLELQLDRKQAILRHTYTNHYMFFEELSNSLNIKTREIDSTDNKAFDDLSQKYEIVFGKKHNPDSKYYIGKKKDYGITVFIKHYHIDNSKHGEFAFRSVHNELKALKDMHDQNCPYTQKLLDIFSDSENIFLVVNALDKCITLDEFIENYKFPDTKRKEALCVEIITKAACALEYFHKNPQPFAHRDIKPKNILINEHSDVYITDFGCSLYYKNLNENTEIDYVGTVGYAAPEGYMPPHNEKTVPDHRMDIYGLGMTLHGILTGNDPLYNPEHHPIRYYDPNLNPVLESIVDKMIDPDREKRYQDISEVIYALTHYQSTKSLKLWLKTVESDKRISQRLSAQASPKPKRSPTPAPAPPPAFKPMPKPAPNIETTQVSDPKSDT